MSARWTDEDEKLFQALIAKRSGAGECLIELAGFLQEIDCIDCNVLLELLIAHRDDVLKALDAIPAPAPVKAGNMMKDWR